ncbi:MAG TPA: hypothetical protein VLV83_07485 [Acidobacteriota bacterium]|nr:hypothetical protein [Acidobacteriota bacterium]
MKRGLLFHGGVSGLRRGDIILPNMAEHRYVEGCPHCEAQREGVAALDPPTPPDWVYASTHKLYARYYASRAMKGDLYKVRLAQDIEESTEDPFPTWRARQATVIRVVERSIALTMKERRNLFLQWGGTEEEFELMLSISGLTELPYQPVPRRP